MENSFIFNQAQILIRIRKKTFLIIDQNDLENYHNPIPPLEIQLLNVDCIESERTLVESAKKLIQIYEQKTKTTIAKLWQV